MALEQVIFNIAAFSDADAGGNNYYASKIYTIHKSEDDTLAFIYSDSGGLNEIIQNGIANRSNDKGEAVFYVEGGVYYITVNGESMVFSVGALNLHNADAAAHPELSAFITSEADRAEASADAAALSGNVFTNTADGIASGLLYFSVVSPDAENYLDLYKNESNVAVYKKSYPSDEYIHRSQETTYSRSILSSVIDGELVSAVSGNTSLNSDYKRTDYIQIEPKQAFRFEGKPLGQTGIAFYDKDKAFISGVESAASGLYSSPSNSAYVIACTNIIESSDLDVFIISISSDSVTVGGESQGVQLRTISNSLVDFSSFNNSDGLLESDGTVREMSSYTVTDFVPVKEGAYLEYSGRAVAPTVPVAFYDKDKVFISALEEYDNIDKVGFNIVENAKYIRACSSNSSPIAFSVNTLSYNDAKDVNELQKSVDALYLAKKNILIGQTLSANLINPDGTIRPSSPYECTDLIRVNNNAIFYYTGRIVQPNIAFAVYDESGSFLEAVTLDTGNYIEQEIKVVNDNAAFIRASSSTFSPEPFKLETLSYNVDLNSKPNIKLIPVSENEFKVTQLTASGEYIDHIFEKIDRPEYSDSGWYSPWVEHEGVNIAQGSFNMIHNVNKVNENKYVGLGHGCEVFKWIRFFVDGKEFDPNADVNEISGDRFHFQFLSDIYAADESLGGGEFAYPKTPLELSTNHYMDCEITADGVKRYNKLIIQRDATVFNRLFGAMQQTNQPPMNGNLLYNAKVPFRVYFPTSNDVAEPLAPDDTVIGGNVALANIDKVTATGATSEYSYTVETKFSNCDNSKRDDLAIGSWTSRTSSNKIYFYPEVTTYTSSVLGKSPASFDAGDVIECYSETKYGVSKL